VTEDAVVVVELRFPSGRYHATPWGAHVNEGRVEYPPSPWRLLRALTAIWHRKLRPIDRHAAETEERVLDRLLASLAGTLPHYRLPPGAPSHTRHYMPPFKGNTTKVLDAFLDLGKEAAVRVVWPGVVLDRDAAALLARLAEVLGFLGRAESWVTAMVVADDEEDRWNAVPLRGGEAVPDGYEVIRLLAPLAPAELDAWRAAELGRKMGETKMTAKQKAKIEASLPRTVSEALEVETGPMRKDGWSQPPGSRWIDYVRPAELTAAAAGTAPPKRAAVLPTAARYVVASQAPPQLTETVAVAERIREALQHHSDGAEVFSGKTADGKPLTGHEHAFIFCEAARHGRIRYVTVYAPMGFDDPAQRALSRLVRVWGHGGHELQMVLAGIGQPKDLGGLEFDAGQCPLLAEARVWISHTPFVPTRHPKAARTGQPKLDDRGLQIGSPEHDLRRLLGEHFPEPVNVNCVRETRLGGRPTRWSAFRTLRRRGGGRRSTAIGYGFRIEFAEPVRGPIAVGYGAHFGLGTFTPESSS
jgi:CRISPR-associated protein Csb2